MFSGLIAIVISPLALVITGGDSTGGWIAFLISPGSSLGHLLSPGLPCGGLLDCVFQTVHAAGRAMEIALVLNAIYYGMLIFCAAAVRSALRRRES